jgi:hypothetical protein
MRQSTSSSDGKGPEAAEAPTSLEKSEEPLGLDRLQPMSGEAGRCAAGCQARHFLFIADTLEMPERRSVGIRLQVDCKSPPRNKSRKRDDVEDLR